MKQTISLVLFIILWSAPQAHAIPYPYQQLLFTGHVTKVLQYPMDSSYAYGSGSISGYVNPTNPNFPISLVTTSHHHCPYLSHQQPSPDKTIMRYYDQDLHEMTVDLKNKTFTWENCDPLEEWNWKVCGVIDEVFVAIPEPSTMILFSFGILGVAGVRRRIMK